jgi:hypothetical protein
LAPSLPPNLTGQRMTSDIHLTYLVVVLALLGGIALMRMLYRR